MNQISEGQLFVNKYSQNEVVFLYSSSTFLVVEEVAELLEKVIAQALMKMVGVALVKMVVKAIMDKFAVVPKENDLVVEVGQLTHHIITSTSLLTSLLLS